MADNDKQSVEYNPVTLELSSLTRKENYGMYRDLNKNGKLDPYEDQSQPIEIRVDDLLGQMTLEEKAGMLFINGATVNEDATLEKKEASGSGLVPGARLVAIDQMNNLRMNHFNLWRIPSAQVVAAWYNKLQKAAEQTRLGIPVTIASDPRNHFHHSIFAMSATDFSQWCETLGFGAIGDETLVKRFAEIVRREYLAVGIRVALHPQIDLATEPRWPRISGTFGEDAALTSRLVKAYIAGFQGESLGPDSVACMTKHFPGGGPQKEGLDPHFSFQKGQVYPGNNFEYHLIPFEAAFEAGTAAIMPYYGIPTNQTDENVAMSFNKAIITGLLREKYRYDGVVCTDWGLVTDERVGDHNWTARAWGAEHLSAQERVLKIINAGVDQFGGESCPHHVVDLVNAKQLTEERINESVRRLLRLKFQLGLFDNPFVDETNVPAVMGAVESVAAGKASQQRAMTLLKNDDSLLPLPTGKKVFVKNIDTAAAAQFADIAATPDEADLAIIRLETPWIPVETGNAFGSGFHHGDLDFKGSAKEEILSLLAALPTVVVIHLDRPAVIPEINEKAAAVIAEFGASDQAMLEVLFGKAKPEGKLPFELPISMEAVRNQKEDLPYDSENPLYPFGFGLTYENNFSTQ